MAVGTGFNQVFQGLGNELPLKGTQVFSLNLSYQVKSVESLFHRPFSNQA